MQEPLQRQGSLRGFATVRPRMAERNFRREQPNRAATAPKRPQHHPGAGSHVIEFRGVSKVYEGGDVGLDQATFGVDRGEFVFVVGHTGSGKSTIMRLLIKELEASAGAVIVAGRELTDIPRKRVPY